MAPTSNILFESKQKQVSTKYQGDLQKIRIAIFIKTESKPGPDLWFSLSDKILDV